MVIGFKLGRRHLYQRPHQAVMVESGHPFQSGQFHRLLGLPRPAPMDHLGLVEPINRLGQGIVVAVALGAPTGSMSP